MEYILNIFLGILIGFTVAYLILHQNIKNSNIRQLKLLFIIKNINQFINNQLNTIDNEMSADKKINRYDDYLLVGYYTALKEITKEIKIIEEKSKIFDKSLE